MSKCFLVECNTDVSKTIKQPLQQTQRIKFTSFDVSNNYIAFGASSGGIYIFRRNPCEFLKLVPSKEGSVSHVAISPDEKIIAISSSRGLVILVENCFTGTNVQYQIYTEHKGNTVTALKWQANELYCGDSFGKVSVISLISILSKAIFQPPSATLMQLGSYIVQLDVYSNYLLVSTRTKTFLCDTKEEQYRQIGKKLRDGDFGACFHSENPLQSVIVRDKEKSIFRNLKEGETFSGPKLEGVKIFCARPGLRMWEVNFDASVVCTHQFRESVSQVSSKVIELGRDEGCRLKLLKCSPVKGVLNFGRVHALGGKYLLSYSSNAVFVFDAKSLTLLYRYSLVDYIRDVKMVDSSIYIWDKAEVKVLLLLDLERLLLKLVASKQYYLCAEICVKNAGEVETILKTSQKIQALNVLKEKLPEGEIYEKIKPLLERIKNAKCLQNGIVVVENGHISEATCSKNSNNNPKLDTNYTNHSHIPNNKTKHLNHATCSKQIDPKQDPNYMLNVLHKQYQVNKMYPIIEIPQISEMLSVKSLEEIVVIFKNFIKHVKESNPEDQNVENWCHHQYLKQARGLSEIPVDSVAFKYIFEAFKSVNDQKEKAADVCKCAFPLPKLKNARIQHYKIGCELIQIQPDLLKSVPYLHKNVLLSTQKENVSSVLPLLIQFSDVEVLRAFSDYFSFDAWDDAFRLLVKLKRKVCLNCEAKLSSEDVEDTFAWKDFCGLAVKSLGPLEAVRLMQRYQKFIPNHELGKEFYQICLFSAVTNERDKAASVVEAVKKDSKVYNKFDLEMCKYLTARQTAQGSIEPISETKSNPKCSSCDLPLNTPILSSDVRLSCGHSFHSLCLESLKSICCVCDVQQN